jgi:hypothetical protein
MREFSRWAAIVIDMDGRELAQLRNGHGWENSVEPRRHILSAHHRWMASQPLELVLAPGDDVRLETRYSQWTGRITLARIDDGQIVPSVHPPGTPLAAQVLGVTETRRSEESIGTDSFRIDNTSGRGRLTRNLRVTREWSRMVSLDLHAHRGVSIAAQIGPNWLALKTSIEQSLEHTYGISVSRREEFAEEIGIEIEPGADISVILTWKRIWQHGFAHVLTQDSQANAPFRMAVGVTFDQTIR